MTRRIWVYILALSALVAIAVPVFIGTSIPPCLGGVSGLLDRKCVARWEAGKALFPDQFVDAFGWPAAVVLTFVVSVAVLLIVDLVRRWLIGRARLLPPGTDPLWTVAISTIAAGVGGFVLALTLTAAPTGILGTSACGPSTVVHEAGFDPWTGQPRGATIQGRCFDHAYVDTQPIPAELVGRTGFPWASALTVGVAAGGFVVGWVLVAARRRSGIAHR